MKCQQYCLPIRLPSHLRRASKAFAAACARPNKGGRMDSAEVPGNAMDGFFPMKSRGFPATFPLNQCIEWSAFYYIMIYVMFIFITPWIYMDSWSCWGFHLEIGIIFLYKNSQNRHQTAPSNTDKSFIANLPPRIWQSKIMNSADFHKPVMDFPGFTTKKPNFCIVSARFPPSFATSPAGLWSAPQRQGLRPEGLMSRDGDSIGWNNQYPYLMGL